MMQLLKNPYGALYHLVNLVEYCLDYSVNLNLSYTYLKTFLLLCVAIGEFFLQLERGWGRVGLKKSGILTLLENLYWNSPYVFYGSRMVPGKKIFYLAATTYYVAAATELCGGRYLIICRPPLNYLAAAT